MELDELPQVTYLSNCYIMTWGLQFVIDNGD